ncbi:hypothetical protein JXL83_06560 [candidate division WOR-3 bacterium]|nr:hypothetical protein [candidate division WOR-3 bacterium]
MGFSKKIIYCDRGPFREYGILKKFIDSNFPESLFIDSEKIRTGEWIKSV